MQGRSQGEEKTSFRPSLLGVAEKGKPPRGGPERKFNPRKLALAPEQGKRFKWCRKEEKLANAAVTWGEEGNAFSSEEMTVGKWRLKEEAVTVEHGVSFEEKNERKTLVS
ncbi:hypothetical protein NDU88_003830 [Pleurodeles waltl]|uniref:Uncharacterized protein n=1 Tax=Pleurodeles waltl TaxID=8319 RepID=A0AAV7UZN0_PLEWA|nr:hypothetical protein NDU88_003830 [Pleurodeles waltl]